MFHTPDKFERHLAKVAPKHIEGYRKGWLTVEKVEEGIWHIYNNEGIITTLIMRW